MSNVSIGIGKVEEGYAVYISKIVEQSKEGCKMLFFDGEKWYPKTERFESLPVVFTLDDEGMDYLQDCLNHCRKQL